MGILYDSKTNTQLNFSADQLESSSYGGYSDVKREHLWNPLSRDKSFPFFQCSRLGDGARYNVGWKDNRSSAAFRVSGTPFKILKPKRWVDPKSGDSA